MITLIISKTPKKRIAWKQLFKDHLFKIIYNGQYLSFHHHCV
ncbi:hypothetical protein MFUM_510002 [Methylacidiphilum fumariolicum SolV]|uniref:Uncharacterized protein n=2 Tax=Candidatus Methylacidiphilum fumarolicum TaxID=591154 RepID=I0JYB7_METFB|nr:conserved protein of unknown function [Candidatus Methylacidiphilum fumarolicum]CCG92236.1 hypothetical protein MFUM_510002 [Methylacidiphilum fumariolicum SolV]